MKKYKISFKDNRYVDILVYDEIDELIYLSDVFKDYIVSKDDIENGKVNICVFVVETKNCSIVNSFKEFYDLRDSTLNELFEILSLFYKKLGKKYISTSFRKIIS